MGSRTSRSGLFHETCREAGNKGSPPGASSTIDGPYRALSVSGDGYYFSGNASAGNITIAGGNIDDHRASSTTVYRNRTTTIKIGGLTLVALLALMGAGGGTVYIARQPDSSGAGTPASLAAEGGHSSPESAVSGFFGDTLLNNWPGACSYELPSEQGMCNLGTSIGTAPQETGSIVTGNAIVDGMLALVPITGRACEYGKCRTFRNGLAPGTSFQRAYAQAMNRANITANLVPCQEVGNEWYVIAPAA